jgi:hypothetical protein
LLGEKTVQGVSHLIPRERTAVLTKQVREHSHVQGLPRTAKDILQSGIAREHVICQGRARRAGANHG